MIPASNRFLVLIAATAFGGCSHTVTETYYEYRVPKMVEFGPPGDYAECGETMGRVVYDSGQKVKVLFNTSRALEKEGELGFLYSHVYRKKVNAILLSNQFTIISGEEQTLSTAIPREFFDHAVFDVTIPSRLENFYLKVPDLEIDGVKHTIPVIEFRKASGERKQKSGIYCW